MSNKLIGLSTTYYATKGCSIYESVEKIVALGFDTVELGAAHSYEEGIWDKLRTIKKDFPEIVFTVHNLFPPFKEKVWFNPADGLNMINRAVVDNLFKSADLLNALLIGIHPPILNEVTLGKKIVGNFNEPIMGKEKDRAESMKKFIELLDYINTRSIESGKKVLIENMDNNYVKTLLVEREDFKKVLERSDNLGILLDVGHAKLCDNLMELVKLNGNIGELHLHDLGDIAKRGKWAHLAISDKDYYKDVISFIEDKSIPLIFEHGADVSEGEILAEKKIVEELRFKEEKSE
jgi:sugar phosphate isomerase/epimerase